MGSKRTDYAKLPAIKYSLVDRGGILLNVGIKAVSLNEYKKMHFDTISKLRSRYKSIIDVALTNMIKPGSLNLTDKGLVLKKTLFIDKVTVDWILTFRIKRLRDPGNYTQKIFQDAVVDCRVIEDDSYVYVRHDRTVISDAIKEDSMTLIIAGKLNTEIISEQLWNNGTMNDEDIRRYYGNLYEEDL